MLAVSGEAVGLERWPGSASLAIVAAQMIIALSYGNLTLKDPTHIQEGLQMSIIKYN